MATTTNEWTETLKDGRRALIRPIRRDDVDRNAAFLDSLSQPSRHFLFLAGVSRLSGEELRRLCDPDYAHDMAYVALDARSGYQQRQIGVCRYAGNDDERRRDLRRGCRRLAALRLGQAVVDPFDRLRAHARRHSPIFDGLAANTRMRKLARDLGFREQTIPTIRAKSFAIWTSARRNQTVGTPEAENSTGLRSA